MWTVIFQKLVTDPAPPTLHSGGLSMSFSLDHRDSGGQELGHIFNSSPLGLLLRSVSKIFISTTGRNKFYIVTRHTPETFLNL